MNFKALLTIKGVLCYNTNVVMSYNYNIERFYIWQV